MMKTTRRKLFLAALTCLLAGIAYADDLRLDVGPGVAPVGTPINIKISAAAGGEVAIREITVTDPNGKSLTLVSSGTGKLTVTSDGPLEYNYSETATPGTYVVKIVYDDPIVEEVKVTRFRFLDVDPDVAPVGTPINIKITAAAGGEVAIREVTVTDPNGKSSTLVSSDTGELTVTSDGSLEYNYSETATPGTYVVKIVYDDRKVKEEKVTRFPLIPIRPYWPFWLLGLLVMLEVASVILLLRVLAIVRKGDRSA